MASAVPLAAVSSSSPKTFKFGNALLSRRTIEPPERNKMEYLIGVILSAVVACFCTLIGFARERSFYPTVLIVVGSYYVLFAAMAASSRTLIVESVVAFLFLLFAVLGFKTNLWFVVAALIGQVQETFAALNVSVNKLDPHMQNPRLERVTHADTQREKQKTNSEVHDQGDPSFFSLLLTQSCFDLLHQSFRFFAFDLSKFGIFIVFLT